MAKKQNKEIKDWDYIAAYVKREEGFRSNVYKDNLGFWTVGVGHLLPEEGQRAPALWEAAFRTRHGADYVQALQNLYAIDLAKHINSVARKLFDYDSQSLSVRACIASMSFQFGGKLLTYDKTKAMLQDGDFIKLASSLEGWKAMKQTPARMRRNQVLLAINTDNKELIKIILDAAW